MISISPSEIYRNAYPTHREKIEEIVHAIGRRLMKKNLSPAMPSTKFYRSLCESITNAMEHGNGWNSGRQIIVKAEMSEEDNSCIISIEDEGNGFDAQTTLENLREKRIKSGLTVISSSCDISWNEKGNIQYITISVKQGKGDFEDELFQGI